MNEIQKEIQLAKDIKNAKLKNLATCKPTEFVKQTVKIKKAVSNWIEKINIQAIMRQKAELIKLTETMTDDERQAAFDKNKELSEKLAKEKISKIFDSVMEKNPDETLEVLALSCFVEPEDVDTHTIDEYFTAWNDMLNNSAAMSFFISLVRLVNRHI